MKFVRDIKNPIQKQQRPALNQKRKFKIKWTTVRDWLLKIIAVGIALTALLFLIVSRDLPDPNRLISRAVPESTKIYARDGSTLLYEVHGEVRRTLIPFDQMNDNVKNATISVEDRNFFHESGIDVRGILRSIFVDITSGGLNQGGSTITQQFVRNAILTTRQKTFTRKIKEIILSLEINERFSKNDILKLYLNEIPYGRNAYGIEAAAQVYFSKHAKDLDLAEAAYLAALPQAPSYYNPTGPHRDALDSRKNIVLDDMYQQGYISADQRDKAKTEGVTFLKSGDLITAPHFVMYIEDYITQKYGEQALQNGGLNVVTTLDPKMQSIAENVISAHAANNEKHNNAYNAALVAIDPKTGQILAMVGSKDFFGTPEPAGCKPGSNCKFEPEVNVALAERQPGSSGKPYVYATAFKQQFGESPATLRMDVVTDFGKFGNSDYVPRNYNLNEYGPVSIRQALAGSLNIPAVKTLDLVGVDNAIQTMRDFGITSPLKDCGLSLVLGGCEVNLLEHTAGYAVLATEGVRHPDTGILKITDSSGNIMEQFQDNPTQVLDPQAAYELINIMSDNNARAFIFGQNNPLTLSDRPVAAKTGTTQSFRDGWTLGFTPSLVAGVWTGNDDNSSMRQGADGVVTAGPIWHDFMQQALAGTTPEAFDVPDGIQNVTVDAVSGLLPTQYTPSTKTEIFANYAVPTTYDNVHLPVTTTDPATGTVISNGVCTTLHSEMPNNPNWEGPVIAYDMAHGYCSGGTAAASGGSPNSSNNNSNGNGTTASNGNTTVASANPPKLSITFPVDGSTIVTPFVLNAQAQADNGLSITKIDLLIDGTQIQTATNAPWNFNVPLLPPGTHVFALHAVDSQGRTADTSIKLNTKQ